MGKYFNHNVKYLDLNFYGTHMTLISPFNYRDDDDIQNELLLIVGNKKDWENRFDVVQPSRVCE